MTIHSLDILLSNFQPLCCFLSSSNCCFLTCIQISQEADKVVSYSHFLKDFPHFVLIHTVKSFSTVNEAEVDFFLEFSWLFCDSMCVGNLISCSSVFSESSLSIYKFLVHVLLNPTLKDFEHHLSSMWNESNFVAVWTLFGIALLWDWNKNWPLPILWSPLSFPNLPTYWVQHFNSIIFRIWNMISAKSWENEL